MDWELFGNRFFEVKNSMEKNGKQESNLDSQDSESTQPWSGRGNPAFNRFTHTYFKADERAVEGVEEEHGERRELRRPVPAVGAVHDDGGLVRLHLVGDLERAAQDEVQMVEPVRAVHVGQPLGVVDHGEAGVAHLMGWGR